MLRGSLESSELDSVKAGTVVSLDGRVRKNSAHAWEGAGPASSSVYNFTATTTDTLVTTGDSSTIGSQRTSSEGHLFSGKADGPTRRSSGAEMGGNKKFERERRASLTIPKSVVGNPKRRRQAEMRREALRARVRGAQAKGPNPGADVSATREGVEGVPSSRDDGGAMMRSF